MGHELQCKTVTVLNNYSSLSASYHLALAVSVGFTLLWEVNGSEIHIFLRRFLFPKCLDQCSQGKQYVLFPAFMCPSHPV